MENWDFDLQYFGIKDIKYKQPSIFTGLKKQF